MKPSSESDETFIDETFIDEAFIDETFIVKEQGAVLLILRAAKNMTKPLGKTTFCDNSNPNANYLIKPMEKEFFGAQIRKRAPKRSKKH